MVAFFLVLDQTKDMTNIQGQWMEMKGSRVFFMKGSKLHDDITVD